MSARGRGGRGGGREGAADAALRLLAARALTASELRERLLRRGYAVDEIDPAVRRFQELGYLDDRALAYNLASALAARRQYGRARTAAELRRRGLPGDAIQDALTKVYADLDEDDLALQAARRAGPQLPGPAGERQRGRLVRSLLRKGLSRGAIAKALRGQGGDERVEVSSAESDDDDFTTDP